MPRSHDADAHLAGVESRSEHWIDADVHVVRGRVRLLRGDSQGARADAADALRLARRSGEPFALFPALAFHARVGAGSGEPAREHLREYLALLEAAQSFWAGRSLPDAVAAAAALGAGGDLRSRLAAAPLRSRWFDAAEAQLAGDHPTAADRYAAIGSRPDEASERLRAADAAEAVGRADEANGQRTRALAFLRLAGGVGPDSRADR